MKTAFFLLLTTSALAVDFDREIRPLLREHCIECHGANKQKGELRLDAKPYALKGGHDGPVLMAGVVAKSPLFQRIISTDDDERMPPKGERLSEEQVATVKAWIESGAVWPENDADHEAAVDKRLQHWSVQPVKVASALAESLGLKPELWAPLAAPQGASLAFCALLGGGLHPLIPVLLNRNGPVQGPV